MSQTAMQRSSPGSTAVEAASEVGLVESPVRAIRAENIIKEFHTEAGLRRVLDGVTFSVAERQRVAILGGNGAGKSTLIQILSGLQLRPLEKSIVACGCPGRWRLMAGLRAS